MSNQDSLTVTLEVLDTDANTKLAKFERNAETVVANTNKSGSKINLSKFFISDLEKMEAKAAQFSRSFTNYLGGFAAGGLAFGAASIGIGKFVDAADLAIQKSIDASRANRLLSASATELGITYAELADKNKKYAEQTGLSDVANASLTSRIGQLARGTGKPQDFDKIYSSFLDLGAAKGIKNQDLETLIGTILSGQDEGLNRLGLPDPSKIYAAYAQQIGKTAEQLTQFERVQAAVNAVVDKGAVFAGANQSRMKSLEGQVLAADRSWQNLTNTLSNNFARSYEVHSFLDTTSKLVRGLTGDVDELQKKISKGIKISDSEITENARPNFVSAAGQNVAQGFFGFMSGFARLADTATTAGTLGLYRPFKESPGKFAETSIGFSNEYQQNLREDFLRQQINAQILADALQKKSAVEQQKALDEQKKKQEEITAQIQLQNDLQTKRTNPLTSLSELEKQYQSLTNDFFGKVNLDSKQKEEEAQKTLKEIYQRTARSFQLSLQNPNNQQNDLRRILGEVKLSDKLLPDTQQGLIYDIEGKIKQSVEAERVKAENTRKQLLAVKDDFQNFLTSAKSVENPFVKLFSDIDTVGERAEKRFGSLGKEVVNFAANLEKANLSKALFEAKIDNNLSAFDLRERAKELRDFRLDATIKDLNKFFADFIESGLKRLENANNGSLPQINSSFTPDGKGFLGYSTSQFSPYTRFHSNIFTDKNGKQFTNGFSQSDARNDLFNVYENVSNGGTYSRRKSFSDLTEKDKLDYLNFNDPANLSIQARLEKQLGIINSGAFTDEQRAIADRKALQISSGFNPAQLNGNLRDQIAAINEREATRKSKYETDALKAIQDTKETLDKVLKLLAEKGIKIDSKGSTNTVRIIDESNGKARITRTPNQSDTDTIFD